MGMNARAQLGYGIPFPEDFEFPWGDRDPKSWWREVHGYVNPQVVEWGKYDREDPDAKAKVDAYFQYEEVWDKAHPPIPFDTVYHGYADGASTILVVPGSYRMVEWGETLDVPETLTPPVYRSRFLDFIERYIPDSPDTRARWVLSAYYG